MTQTYSKKYPTEIIPLSWDFAPLLGVGETISGVTWQIINPEDPTEDTSNMLPDGPAISGTVVKQRVANGKNGTSYKHIITIITSLDNVYVETPTELVTINNEE